jgi:1-acyl-sn-glycerol-3-phosphate acyltransferase
MVRGTEEMRFRGPALLVTYYSLVWCFSMRLYRFSIALLRVFLRAIGGATYVGLENIPATGGVILASNHISFADPPLVGCGTRRQVHYMAKEQLFKPPFFGWWMHAVGSFPVRRGAPDRRALKRAIELLNEGRVVGIFPEGTRSEDGGLQEPELGIGLIALKSRAPVVPVAVIGTDKALPPHSKRMHRHPMTAIYGKPLTFPDLYDVKESRKVLEEVGRRTMAAISDLISAHTR